MINITEYSEDELSFRVFNTESLYDLRHSNDIVATLDEMFIYTPEQLETLQEALEEDKEEQDA